MPRVVVWRKISRAIFSRSPARHRTLKRTPGQVIELIQNWIAEHPGAVPNVVFAAPRMYADAFREAFGAPEPERPAPVVVAEDEGDREGDDEDWRNVELPEGITLR